MGKSLVRFERWKPREKSTWPFQVFQKHTDELERFLSAHISGSKFVYSSLGKTTATWSDSPTKYFAFHLRYQGDLFKDVRDWSNAFNSFGNWTRLNAVIALTSNLETYMASVMSLALESDPGILIGAPRAIDGIALLKHGVSPPRIAEYVEACTKGDWNSRTANYRRIFGSVPSIVMRKLADLEAIRMLRNRVSHAFGRDIKQARKHWIRTIIPMERLSIERALRYKRLVWSCAKEMDLHLHAAHIGEYQALRFYHSLYPSLNKKVHPNQRAIYFKKEFGRFKAAPAGKLFSNELVKYYERL